MGKGNVSFLPQTLSLPLEYTISFIMYKTGGLEINKNAFLLMHLNYSLPHLITMKVLQQAYSLFM